ncbi:MAG: CvpA family protein [Bacilli bacterium]|nr:CvpA family protein [Bacilli bacterium]MDD3305014.1 CvpA family protein [Bacilli bacterium]MDD4053655.1 CvpA family protein [Bacilli bacterium]MDD4411154.1 CvpA family protein [Bacilli bacterium]
MQVVDVIILLMLGMGAVIGFKRGFIRQTVQSLGGILVVVCAFLFRGPVAEFLFKIFPSFEFDGIFSGITSLNILVYEVIAFIILLIIFGLIFRVAVVLATFIEKFFDATIILAIPSRILGALMGLVEYYLLVFIALFILTLPVFNIDIVNKSRLKDKILEGTPIVSNLAKKTVNSFDDIYALRDDFVMEADRLKLDQKVLQILIDNKVVTTERAVELYEDGKIDAR